jgi:hypothetical protein
MAVVELGFLRRSLFFVGPRLLAGDVASERRDDAG